MEGKQELLFSGLFFKMFSHISSTFSSTDGNNKTTLNLNLEFHGVKMSNRHEKQLRDNFQTLFRSNRIATWSVRSLKLAEQEALN